MQLLYMVMGKREFENLEKEKEIVERATENLTIEYNRPFVLLEISNVEVCEPVQVRINWRGL